MKYRAMMVWVINLTLVAANANAVDRNGFAPLHFAVYEGCVFTCLNFIKPCNSSITRQYKPRQFFLLTALQIFGYWIAQGDRGVGAAWS